MEREATSIKYIKLFIYGNQLMFSVSKTKYILLILLSFCRGIAAPINALIWERFLNQLTNIINLKNDAGRNEWIYLILLSLVPFWGYIVNLVLQYVEQTFSDQMNLYITEKVLNKALSIPMKMYDDAVIYNDINLAMSKTAQNCLNLLSAVAEIIFSLIQGISFVLILIYFDYRIIFLSILGVIPSLYVAFVSNKRWFKTISNRIEKLRHIDYLKGLLIKNEYVKEIRLYDVGSKVLKYIQKCIIRFINEDKALRKNIFLKRTGAQLFDEILNFIIKAWIFVASLNIKSSVGTIVLYFNSQEHLKSSCTILLSELAKLHDSILYIQVLKRIDNIEVICDIPQNMNCDVSFENIEFRNVSFSYTGQEKQVLKNISFKFEKGKTYSIVGVNGAGKTTLFKLLLGLYEPQSGEIFIDGVPLKYINKLQYYKYIGAVFQDFIKYPLSIEENIISDFGEANRTNLEQAIKFASLDNMIKMLPDGIKTVLMREWNHGTEISQGQWQKIAIARCYYRNPKVMILDEPFSSIDIEAESHIIRKMKEIADQNMNIFITHHFSSISMADQIIVINNGELVEQGTHKELMDSKGKYYQLYIEQLNNLKKMKI